MESLHPEQKCLHGLSWNEDLAVSNPSKVPFCQSLMVGVLILVDEDIKGDPFFKCPFGSTAYGLE